MSIEAGRKAEVIEENTMKEMSFIKSDAAQVIKKEAENEELIPQNETEESFLVAEVAHRGNPGSRSTDRGFPKACRTCPSASPRQPRCATSKAGPKICICECAALVRFRARP